MIPSNVKLFLLKEVQRTTVALNLIGARQLSKTARRPLQRLGKSYQFRHLPQGIHASPIAVTGSQQDNAQIAL
jgi:hypothetical protein